MDSSHASQSDNIDLFETPAENSNFEDELLKKLLKKINFFLLKIFFFNFNLNILIQNKFL